MNAQNLQTQSPSASPTSPIDASLACAAEPLSQSPPAILNAPDPAAQALACLDTSAAVPDTIDASQLPVPDSSRKSRRNGRVACLPRLQRDMVNRMIWNSVPYKNIVAALQENGFSGISERNISNWASGGYLEWSLAQEQAIQHRLQQDHLLDFLRRDDAPELPEVGLQAAATRLSQVFLQKLARADDPEAHLYSYSRLVDLLCRLNREIAAVQKHREDSSRALGRHSHPLRIRDFDERETLKVENHYSDPPAGSTLPHAPIEPFLVPEALSELLAQNDREQAEFTHQLNLAGLGVFKRPNGASSKKPQASVQPPTAVPVTPGNPTVAPGKPQ